MSSAPWKPVDYALADAVAVQALVDGEATADQQKRIASFLINALCATYDQSYRPGEEGRRETDFAEGRRFVGLTLVKMARKDLNDALRRQDDG